MYLLIAANGSGDMLNGINWVNVGANLGAFALVAWLVKHTFQHTIPRLAGTFEKALAKLTNDFREELTECRSEISQQRQEFREELKEERQVIRELHAALDRNTESLISLKEDADDC